MSGHDRKADPVDEASEESFPASDPPSFTPVSHAAEEETDSEAGQRQIVEAEHREKKRDPHGASPAGGASEGEPAGSPHADRHKTETAIERVQKP